MPNNLIYAFHGPGEHVRVSRSNMAGAAVLVDAGPWGGARIESVEAMEGVARALLAHAQDIRERQKGNDNANS